ncbi:MAG TPA: glycerol kinase GlpK, partial [Burkholderiaceae bacterium]|nr:glycerol kinase GlpK [Burkholderiaceae bacterium]
MEYVLALDQGTTSSRAILFDHGGRPVSVAQQELRQHFPQPGWVEHDPDEIWSSQLQCARQVLRAAAAGPHQVAAIGIANQRETTVIWDRASGRPIAPAIVWQDRRTSDVCARLREQGHEPDLTARTGLVLDPYFSATKVGCLLDHVPGARARAERGELAFGTIDSWLIWNLTGEHVTDVSNASRTSLFNLAALDWDEHLLSLFNVPRAILPRVTASSRIIGRARSDCLGAEIAVAGNAGDQQAATFGQACFTPGMAKNTYGTGCFLLANTGSHPHPSANRLLTTVGWQLGSEPPTYLLEGSVFVGGAVVQWLRDGLGLIRDSAEVEALARQVQDSGGVFVVPAFAGLGAPYWDSNARGAIVGLTRGSTRAHLARAALESIALQSAELLAAMQDDCSGAISELRVDGGAARNDLLMQMQADALGIAVVRPAVTETTALGAA